MRACLAALLLFAASPATAQGVLDIPVRVTGAIEREGTYRHEASPAHRCGDLRVYPAPAPGQSMMHLPTMWQVLFNPGASPPEASFELTFVMDGGLVRARLTAGGRVWESDERSRAELRPAPDHRNGAFTLRDLRDGEDRVTVSGRWSCPG
jgi:hypothetical protein